MPQPKKIDKITLKHSAVCCAYYTHILLYIYACLLVSFKLYTIVAHTIYSFITWLASKTVGPWCCKYPGFTKVYIQNGGRGSLKFEQGAYKQTHSQGLSNYVYHIFLIELNSTNSFWKMATFLVLAYLDNYIDYWLFLLT